MILNFKNIFGHCIIPKDTLLYRGHTDTLFQDCMFFALKFWVAGAFNNSVQVWRVTREIEILFLVESVDYRSWTESAIPRLYKTVFPHEVSDSYDDLDIKHRNIEIRNRFIKKLSSDYSLTGWLTSLEGAIDLEICLFKENQVELKEIVNKGSKKYYRDSLKQIDIFPSQDFYKNTYDKLINKSQMGLDKTEIWNKYQEHMTDMVKEGAKNKNDIVINRECFSNLRTRLEI